MNFSNDFIKYIKEHNITDDNISAISNTETVRDNITNQINKKMNEFTPLYNDNTPIPGESFDVERIHTNKTLKDEAEQELIAGAAIRKVREERNAEMKRPLEERIKETYIEGCMQALTDESYEKRGHALSGSERRSYRKKIERSYGKKPQFTPTREQREKIIDYLNMPSSEKSKDKKEVQPTSGLSSAKAVSTLLSSI